MKVGILGSGDVAKSLGSGFLSEGHQVMLGTRDASKLDEWKKSSGGAVGSFADAAAFGDSVVVATLGIAAEEAIRAADLANFADKVVIDATNPLDFRSGGAELAWGFNDSNGERVQKALANAKVVKAFNTVGNQFFYRPDLPGGPPTMFIAGNDPGAKSAVAEICKSFGWDVADTGGIESSRYLEAMCMTWVRYGVTNGGWNHAFKLLRSPSSGA